MWEKSRDTTCGHFTYKKMLKLERALQCFTGEYFLTIISNINAFTLTTQREQSMIKINLNLTILLNRVHVNGIFHKSWQENKNWLYSNVSNEIYQILRISKPLRYLELHKISKILKWANNYYIGLELPISIFEIFFTSKGRNRSRKKEISCSTEHFFFGIPANNLEETWWPGRKLLSG